MHTTCRREQSSARGGVERILPVSNILPASKQRVKSLWHNKRPDKRCAVCIVAAFTPPYPRFAYSTLRVRHTCYAFFLPLFTTTTSLPVSFPPVPRQPRTPTLAVPTENGSKYLRSRTCAGYFIYIVHVEYSLRKNKR